jgi:ABC-type nitrate/sulfonate/bicarbonate transport system permease component
MTRWRLLLGPLILVALWTAITVPGFVRPIFLPTPWHVLSTLGSLLADGPLWRDAGATLYRTGVAFLIAAGIGVVVGVPLGIWSRFYESFEVVFDFFRSMPSPALIPLAMLLFGLGNLSRIAVAAFTCSLINAIQASYAVRTIPRYRILGARLSGAKGIFLVVRVLIPSVLPGLVAGWRITLSLSLIIVVVSEMFIGTRTGLGMRIYDYHLMFRSTEMYATILVVGLIGYFLNKTLEVAERRFVHWAGK